MNLGQLPTEKGTLAMSKTDFCRLYTYSMTQHIVTNLWKEINLMLTVSQYRTGSQYFCAKVIIS